MANHVAGVSSVGLAASDAFGAGVSPREAGQQGRQQAEKQAPDAGRYRLTIEKEAAGFVYKTLDRVTGEVIRQLPREEVLKMRQSPAYDVGKVFKTSI